MTVAEFVALLQRVPDQNAEVVRLDSSTFGEFFCVPIVQDWDGVIVINSHEQGREVTKLDKQTDII